jgi:ATP-dependent protease ClpP protease subunit
MRFLNEGERASAYIYGTIGDPWDMDSTNAKDFSEFLDSLNGKPLDIRIDSGGGDVYEAFAIASAIQRYEGETVAYVDGLAASAASYVAESADKVVMNDFAEFMIHKAWAYAQGNSNEMLSIAERLEAIDENIANVISKRSGMPLEDVKAAMEMETWYSAKDAVENGLADELVETEQRIAACVDPRIMAHYKNVPEGIVAEKPIDEPEESHTPETIAEDEEQSRSFVLIGNRVYES